MAIRVYRVYRVYRVESSTIIYLKGHDSYLHLSFLIKADEKGIKD